MEDGLDRVVASVAVGAPAVAGGSSNGGTKRVKFKAPRRKSSVATKEQEQSLSELIILLQQRADLSTTVLDLPESLKGELKTRYRRAQKHRAIDSYIDNWCRLPTNKMAANLYNLMLQRRGPGQSTSSGVATEEEDDNLLSALAALDLGAHDGYRSDACKSYHERRVKRINDDESDREEEGVEFHQQLPQADAFAELVAAAHEKVGVRASCYVYVDIGGVTVPALIDSGAGIHCAVNGDMLNKLRGRKAREEGKSVPKDIREDWDGYLTDSEVAAVSGAGVPVTGRYEFLTGLGPVPLETRAIDMPTSQYPILYGADFLYEHDIDLILSRNILKFRDGTEVPLHGRKSSRNMPRTAAAVLQALIKEGASYPGTRKINPRANLETSVTIARTTVVQPGGGGVAAILHSNFGLSHFDRTVAVLMAPDESTSPALQERVGIAATVDLFHPGATPEVTWHIANPYEHSVIVYKGERLGRARLVTDTTLTGLPERQKRTRAGSIAALGRISSRLVIEEQERSLVEQEAANTPVPVEPHSTNPRRGSSYKGVCHTEQDNVSITPPSQDGAGAKKRAQGRRPKQAITSQSRPAQLDGDMREQSTVASTLSAAAAKGGRKISVSTAEATDRTTETTAPRCSEGPTQPGCGCITCKEAREQAHENATLPAGKEGQRAYAICAIMRLHNESMREIRRGDYEQNWHTQCETNGIRLPATIAALKKARKKQASQEESILPEDPKGLDEGWKRELTGQALADSVADLNIKLTKLHEGWLNSQGDDDESGDDTDTHADRADRAAATAAPELTDIQRETLRRWLISQEDICGEQLGVTPMTKHNIELLPGAVPKKFPVRRFSQTEEAEIQAEIERWLKEDNIEPADGPWAAPLVVARKKGGALRLCVDYRYVNSQQRKDSYPLPRIDSHLDKLGGAQFYTTLDLRAAYNHVEIPKEDREITAFVHGTGVWQYKRMPFGLTNAPATFARLMDKVLGGLQYDYCLAYLDDIIIASRSFEEHMKHLDEVFSRLRAAKLTVKLEKSSFCRDTVPFLGHIVCREGRRPDPAKVKAVHHWVRPTCPKDIRAFLGLAGYYAMYIRGFAELAAPLRKLQGKNSTWHWEDVHEQAFLRVKLALSTEVVLQHPNWKETFYVQTDACDYGMGAVLVQLENGVERPVAFASKAFSPAERNYHTTEQEALAVKWAVCLFRPYIHGTHFVIQTDHSALKYIFTTKNVNGRVGRWAMALQEYDFEVEHRPGVANIVPDALSRYPLALGDDPPPTAACIAALAGERGYEIDEDGPTNEVIQLASHHPAEQLQAEARQGIEAVASIILGARSTTEVYDRLRAAQMADVEFTAPLLKYLDEGKLPDLPQQADALKRRSHHYLVREGLLHRRAELFVNSDDEDDHNQGSVAKQGMVRLVIPPTMREEIMRLFHDDPRMGSHMASVPMTKKMALRYYWPGMGKDIESHCKTCWHCGTGKDYRQRAKREDRGRNVPTVPFREVAFDLSGPHHKTASNKHEYVLVIMCMYSNWVEAIPLRRATAKTVMQAFLDVWVRRYGCPRVLVSDRGNQFASELTRAICKKLGTEQQFCAAYRPDANGKVERFMGVWKDLVKMYVNDKQDNWDEKLPSCIHAYVCSPKRHLGGYSPYYVIFGHHPRLPVDLILPAAAVEDQGEDNGERLKTLLRLQDAVYRHQCEAQERRVASKKAQNPEPNRLVDDEFQVGSCVLLQRVMPKDVSQKMAHRYDGPFWVQGEPHTGSRDIFGLKLGRPYAEAAVAVERLKPAPYHLHGTSWTTRHPKQICGKTYAQIQKEFEAKDSSTDTQLSDDEKEDGQWHVERILDHRPVKVRAGRKCLEYLIRWKDRGSDLDAWHHEDELNCDRRIRDYFEQLAHAPIGPAARASAPVAQPSVQRPKRPADGAASAVGRRTRRRQATAQVNAAQLRETLMSNIASVAQTAMECMSQAASAYEDTDA
jgi:transposase InsO family protein